MALNFRNFFVGARFRPVTTLTSDKTGEVQSFLTDNKTYLHNGTTRSPLVTADHAENLTLKTIDADNNTISNLEVDNLKAGVLNTSTTLAGATDAQVPSALAVKTYADTGTSTVQTNLDNHINDTTGAHAATAISASTVGVAGIDVQANLTDLKAQIDTKGTGNGDVIGPASSTDNAIARFDLATGKLIQDSVVTVSDTGIIAGASIDADTNVITNIENADIKAGAAIARNKLASGTNNAVVHNNASGVQTDSADLLVGTNALILQNTKHLEVQSATDSTTTGTAATLTAFTAGTIRLTNVSLVSIATIPAGANGQKLTLINRTGNAITILTSGNILLGTSTTAILENNGAFSFDNDSTSAKWQLSSGAGSSSSGMGGINYITNFNAEIDTTGWTTYADAAGTAPVDGTGGSPTVTLTRSTSSPLRGTASFLYTKPASNVQGQGFSYDFTIDSADTGKVLQGSFDYQIASGTFADDAMSVWIYDITNARMIQPAPYLLKNSGIIERFPIEFQTAINSTSYRLIIHQASTSAVASTIKFDNFNVGPQAKLYGSPITSPIPFTSTFTNMGNATQALSYQKIGNTVRITGTIIVGSTLPTSTITFSLPLGMSADYSSVPKGIANTDQYQAVGYATSYPGGVTGRIQRSASSLTDFVIGYTSGALWNATTPATWSAGQTFTLDLVVPIQGWSSSQIMSSDADTRVVDLAVSGSTTSIPFNVGTAIVFPTVSKDSHGAYNSSTGIYTVQVPGDYYVSTSISSATSLTPIVSRVFRVDVTASSGGTFFNHFPVQSTTTLAAWTVSATGILSNLKAGDTIRVFGLNNLDGSTATVLQGGTINSLNIYRISGPSQIAASESVSALYTGAPPTGTLNTTRNTVTFGTKVKDSHNTYSGGVYTVPVSGCYDISAQVDVSGTYVAGYNSQVAISIDGALASYIQPVSTGGVVSSLTPCINIKSIPLRAGQTVTIQASTLATSPSYSADARLNFFSISKSGNY